MSAHTPGPWDFVTGRTLHHVETQIDNPAGAGIPVCSVPLKREADARLIAAAPYLLEALREGRRAIGEHFVPDHCYATGPLTGDSFRDLVQCPACSFIAMYDAAIAKATGSQP
jgi:hypothetical protein